VAGAAFTGNDQYSDRGRVELQTKLEA